MLRIDDLTCRIGGRTLMEGARLSVPGGAKVGLVGRNGAGKTTLLRLIAGELQPDAGHIDVPARTRIAVMSQQAPDGPESLLDAVLAADGERTRLLAAAQSAADPHHMGEIHARLADMDAHGAPARAATILAGLGFPEAAQSGSCSALSGGLRMRIALARVLFAESDLLLLDEPSNHLDLESTGWLETYLASHSGTLILVSHDRRLLDRVTRRTVHLTGGRLDSYRGGYSTFERTLRERRQSQRRAAARLAGQRRRMTAFIERFRAKATKARQAQSRIKMLERLEPAVPVIIETPVNFDFPEPEALPPPVLTLDRAAVGYGDGPAVLTGLDLRIDMDDRMALVGRNGNGKSTLARLLAGRLDASAGTVRRARKLRIGYFAQHQTEELDLAASGYRHLARLEPDTGEPRLRAHLGRFGFSGDGADVPAGRLSGGEKACLLLALMSRAAPHMLILDEPTNHLDIEAREAFAAALNAFSGAVVLITHDAHLIALCAERLYLVADGTCRPFDGDIDAYMAWSLTTEAKPKAAPHASGRQKESRRDVRRRAAKARAGLTRLRREIGDAEAGLEAVGAEKAEIERRLADPAVYDGPADALGELLKRQGEIARRFAEAEARWLAAQEALEAARISTS
ncbi:MAG: ABC-F family ATP-binding cassette domain-containing protein [Proteobacteria bacterium]|nr:ABC-F family ATP-binding cassette domain-containing protein [Pseudomonadota bacterium]